MIPGYKDKVHRDTPVERLQGSVERVTQAWAEQKVIREFMVFLQSHGAGTARAASIYKTYGDQAVSLSVNGKVTVITGCPGVGKTTVLKSWRAGTGPSPERSGTRCVRAV